MKQIERTRRYLDRIRKIYAGAPYVDDPTYYTDDVLSFFIHCHHIRDWIKELHLLGITSAQLTAFIRENRELRICADLCNGTKHCYFEENRQWTKRQPHIATTSFTSGGTNNVFTTTMGKFQIMSDGEFMDALALAERCMTLWDEFVESMMNATNKASHVTSEPAPGAGSSAHKG